MSATPKSSMVVRLQSTYMQRHLMSMFSYLQQFVTPEGAPFIHSMCQFQYQYIQIMYGQEEEYT